MKILYNSNFSNFDKRKTDGIKKCLATVKHNYGL